MLSQVKRLRTVVVGLMVVVLLSGLAWAKKPVPPPDPEPDPPPVTYNLTLFGGMPNDWLWPYAINEAGEIVGYYESDGIRSAFVFTADWGFVDLNTMLPAGFSGHLEIASDINNYGQVVGWMEIDEEIRSYKLTLPMQVDGVALVQDLGKLHDDDRWLRAFGGINDAGEVAGHGSNVNSERFAWYYNDLVGLASLMEGYPDISVMTINNNGRILGRYYAPEPVIFRVVPGMTPEFYYNEVGLSWEPDDMNDSGSFVGYRGVEVPVNKKKTRVVYRAFRHDGATLIDIAGDDSRAYAINNNGDVVGESQSLGGPFVYLESLQEAFCFEDAVIGDPDDLLVWYSYPNYTPTDINDSGQICGHIMNMYADDFLGFVLTPIPPEE